MTRFNKNNSGKRENKTMKITKAVPVFMALLSLGIVETASAHHSFAMFDRSREEVLDGTVVRWAFNSPHVALYIETEDGTLYSLEGAAPPALITRPPAMNGFTFQPGNHVRVVYCPLQRQNLPRSSRPAAPFATRPQADQDCVPNGQCLSTA